MKTKLLLGVVLTLLATASGPLRAQNIVSNGGFELPAFAGDGDAYPLGGAAFGIPDWFVCSCTGLFIEHGLHRTDGGLIARYADGRQAICLKSQDHGLEASISTRF